MAVAVFSHLILGFLHSIAYLGRYQAREAIGEPHCRIPRGVESMADPSMLHDLLDIGTGGRKSDRELAQSVRAR